MLIKLAWGGKSLAKDFRPPSSGGEVGPCYKEMLSFGWHQGWNDRVNQAFNDEYEKNLANLIRDLRKDLGVKNLPFVTAETGMTGNDEKHPRAISLGTAMGEAMKRLCRFEAK